MNTRFSPNKKRETKLWF